MSIGRKRDPGAIARLECGGSRASTRYAAYGDSVEQLPAAFWKHVADSLTGPAAEDALEAPDWLLVQAAREFGYHAAQQIISSTTWSGFIAPLDSDRANQQDVLHTVFAALTGLGLDGCEVLDLVPFEHLLLRVHEYRGLVATLGRGGGRETSLLLRGLCAGVMDLAYAGPYDRLGRFTLGSYDCRQTRATDRGDRYDEFSVHRRPI